MVNSEQNQTISTLKRRMLCFLHENEKREAFLAVTNLGELCEIFTSRLG
jgi:hypothetical protein